MKTLNLLLLTIMLFVNCSSVNKESDSNQGDTKPVDFTGKLLLSDDQGNSWTSLDPYISKDMNIISLFAEGETLSMGSENGIIQNIDLTALKMSSTQNVMTALINKNPVKENWVSDIFALTSGHYTHVFGEGLFRKESGSKLWQPIFIPEGIHGISKMTEDTQGNIYLACQYGVYKTMDQCKTWDRVFTLGYANDIIFHNETLWMVGINGVHNSSDAGKTWSKVTNIQNLLDWHSHDSNVIRLFENENNIYILKRNVENGMMNADTGGALIYSDDNGKTWKNHQIELHLKAQNDIQNVFFQKENWYYTTKNNLMKSEDKGVTWKNMLHIPLTEKNMSFRVLIAGDKLIVSKQNFGC
jgi:photosystem II stability/assembly factor-like uncharacterized protein